MDEFIRYSLGENFVNPPVTLLEDVYRDTDFKTPIIFIISPGADPLLNILVIFLKLFIILRGFLKSLVLVRKTYF